MLHLIYFNIISYCHCESGAVYETMQHNITEDHKHNMDDIEDPTLQLL